MSYTRNTWAARTGTGLNRFLDQEGTLFEFTPLPSLIINPGTPFSADWMNNIEAGILAAHDEIAAVDDAKQNTITATGILKGAGAGNISAAVAGTDYARAPVTLSKTLTAAGWSSGQQVISDAAIYSASAPGDVRIAQSASDAQFEAWNKAQPRVVAQAVGSVTVKIVGDVPAVDIPVVLEVR